jgi:hypothetical protein
MNKIANIVNCQQQKILKISQKMTESVKLAIFVTKQFFFWGGEGGVEGEITQYVYK